MLCCSSAGQKGKQSFNCPGRSLAVWVASKCTGSAFSKLITSWWNFNKSKDKSGWFQAPWAPDYCVHVGCWRSKLQSFYLCFNHLVISLVSQHYLTEVIFCNNNDNGKGIIFTI